MTATTSTNNTTTDKPAAKTPTPRKPRTPRKATRPPVSREVTRDEPVTHTLPSTALASADESRLAAESIQTFANAIGAVEALAYVGQHELIMQLARIAYTRGRQTARAAGVNVD